MGPVSSLPPQMALPSAGAVLHSQGSCKPCAWFWKPQGCKNGAECRHCHLCSPEELDRRKKDKVSRLRDAGVPRKPAYDSSCAKANEGVHDLSLRLFFSVWKRSTERIISQSFQSSSCKLVVPTHVDDFVGDRLVPTEQDLIADACGLTNGKRHECNGACESVGISKTNPPLPSEGSRLHGSGKCRPCSFFWKPQGCQFGAECQHCHLCPEDEQKRRKKVKTDALRAAGVPKAKRGNA